MARKGARARVAGREWNGRASGAIGHWGLVSSRM